MTDGPKDEKDDGQSKKAKYVVNIEGQEHPWDRDTITVPQIRELAGWEPTQQVMEVNLKDNTEETLGEDAVIKLKPGSGFAKKIRFQRG
jgi:hypothetical protein